MPRPKTVDPTAEQLASGQYKRTFVMHTESATATAAYVSRHDPVQRWKSAGKLSDSQIVAIDFVRRLWEIAGLEQTITSPYGEKIPGRGDSEGRTALEIDARRDLHRVVGYFPPPLDRYWNVFEQVCRHGEPAGVAGSRLGFGSRSAQDRAHMIVCHVADTLTAREKL